MTVSYPIHTVPGQASPKQVTSTKSTISSSGEIVSKTWDVNRVITCVLVNRLEGLSLPRMSGM